MHYWQMGNGEFARFIGTQGFIYLSYNKLIYAPLYRPSPLEKGRG
jgi:hypothetical protein